MNSVNEYKYATPTIFPSMEYADEKYREKDGFGIEGMSLIRPPVRRSQVMCLASPVNRVNEQLSGEKLIHRVASSFVWGCVKV